MYVKQMLMQHVVKDFLPLWIYQVQNNAHQLIQKTLKNVNLIALIYFFLSPLSILRMLKAEVGDYIVKNPTLLFAKTKKMQSNDGQIGL